MAVHGLPCSLSLSRLANPSVLSMPSSTTRAVVSVVGIVSYRGLQLAIFDTITGANPWKSKKGHPWCHYALRRSTDRIHSRRCRCLSF